MTNLTISIDEEVLKKARIKALEQRTSVNSVLREYPESYAGVNRIEEKAIENILKLSDNPESGRGKVEWTRDEIHERW